MSLKKRRRRNVDPGTPETAELNIMPFIDVFSVLNTFLLMSAVFLSVGIIKVQIPFLTNKDVPTKPKRSLSVSVDVRPDQIGLETSYSAPPANPQKFQYPLNPAGITDLHKRLVMIRTSDPETDLLTLYSEDDVKYEDLAKVLDAIKLRKSDDPVFDNKMDSEEDDPTEKANNKIFVFPKVVMGSVIL